MNMRIEFDGIEATREWKPGDVAERSYLHGKQRSLVVDDCGTEMHARGLHWHHERGGWDGFEHNEYGPKYRPLVVIDPEDYDAALRLARLIPDDKGQGQGMQAALREFANPTPPKPDEPTGWLAAVEDTDGRRWYRDGDPDSTHPWRQVRDDGIHARDQWGLIPRTVRVISEGVPS